MTNSAVEKGKRHEKKTKELIYDLVLKPQGISKQDILPTTKHGADIRLSKAAQDIFPFDLECKHYNQMAIYKIYEQAMGHGNNEPLAIITADYKPILAVLEAEFFLKHWGVIK